MKVKGVKCGKCGDVLFSRARHDFRKCTCEETFVDGGFDYLRVGYAGDFPPVTVELEVGASKQELYDDWNMCKDQYGLIKKGEK